MDQTSFRMPLYLPAQGAVETEATIVEWRLAEGDPFSKGQVLAQIDSVKSVYDFEAPCAGRVLKIRHQAGETVAYTEPVLDIETADPAMKDWIPPAASGAAPLAKAGETQSSGQPAAVTSGVVILSVGGYLPQRVVTNAELLKNFADVSEEYIFQVTGIRERRWASDLEKPSDMAYAAALEAIRKANLPLGDIDAILVSTTTPDVAMPSTACILQARLNLGTIPAFDLNAACSGWLYTVAMAQAMILSGMARNVLTVGVDMQSHFLDRHDRSTCFLFGDGAGAAIISGGTTGHRVRRIVFGSDIRGIHLARRDEPGYRICNGDAGIDPWIRVDGPALFRFATETFTGVVRDVIARTGWTPEETRWVIPHQANARILKAAARRCGVPFDRFFLNVERVGNTSSASIPLALLDAESSLVPGDKLVLCSVGAGATMAAVSVEW
jgi:3-oxoacyl-[acyl-carrier-protein] synthase-3